MVVRVIIAGLLFTLCMASKIQYPEKDPCILIDFVTNNSFSWTPENGTEVTIPNWNMDRTDVIGGNCSTEVREVTIFFQDDNSTMTFGFRNTSGTVDVSIALEFVPSMIFDTSTDNSSYVVKTTLLKTGAIDKVYKCYSEEKVSGTSNKTENGTFKLTMRFMNATMQGFGVVNGTFGKEIDECPADKPTTVQPNTTVTIVTVTTEPNPTTAPPPKPTSAPKVTLNATDGNITCAMLVGEITLTIPYNGTKKAQKTATVFVPETVNSTGKCDNTNKTDILMATFGNGWKMDFVFKGDNDNVWLDQLNLTLVFDAEHFPDIDPSQKNKTMTSSHSFSKAFKAKNDGSYLCNSDSNTDLSDGIKLKTKDFQYTALQKNVTAFTDKNVAECSADAKTSSIVPIAVGAALAGLVVIVLIAYLIGRRRNRKGYESV